MQGPHVVPSHFEGRHGPDGVQGFHQANVGSSQGYPYRCPNADQHPISTGAYAGFLT